MAVAIGGGGVGQSAARATGAPTGAGDALARVLRRLATLPTHVLLVGETGVGKGVAARALHAAGPRRGRPFVHVDCSALSPALIESELFGHERGAFTGADAARRGRIESAADGTLFLDEIGELPRPVQAKLLRLLQDRCYERVGGDRERTLQARIVAATHVDLAEAVARGRFRADLYWRLRVAVVRVPPLRERIDELPALVARLLPEIAARLGVACPEPEPGCLARLARHPWPGNVRELANVLEARLAFGAGPRLAATDLEPWLGEPAPAPALAAPVAAAPHAEAARLAAVLCATGGNVSRAARRLGLSRAALRRRIERHGLAPRIPRD